VSHRNGYEPRTVVTTAGPVELECPRVRTGQQLGVESRILGRQVVRTYAQEPLIICSSLRGLSVRDVEAALAETFEPPVIGSRPSGASARTRVSRTGAGASAGSMSTITANAAPPSRSRRR
jgi:putative transposase